MAVIIGGGTGNAISINGSVGAAGQVITSNGTDVAWAAAAAFDAGTLMLFQQTSAPTGWTKQTTHNDKSLRVVSGTASSGGTTAFTSVFASRAVSGTTDATTLDTTQIPSHAHSYTFRSTFGGLGPGSAANWRGDLGVGTGAAGSGGSHTHTLSGATLDFNVQYVDLIIASKN